MSKYYEYAVLWLTDNELSKIYSPPLPALEALPNYLWEAIKQSFHVKVRPHIINPVANIPDFILPCLNEDKKTTCQTTGKIFEEKCLGIIVKGDDIDTLQKTFPGFITDFKLSPINA